ncbi:molecular chaperone TorD family protein [Shewanella yunxiaonensis]|uniref:Molecular chaperone TorD family protein n=1 Tax=Shewanella yunxiaonensis TaxID=2829809 RepID=A0ABX7YTV8_9GAMM|nr:molecular chaperone TorD family protein [Shewanella yunxiaonensis]QUN05764.1 molecular chaperone TorD family protein [Shewanella yunxiaonensis]
MQLNISSDTYATWGALANVLGYLLHQYPERELIDDFKEQKLALTWPILASSSDERQALEALAHALADWDSSEEQLVKLKLDFGRLFFGPGEPIAAPWGSIYLCESQILFDRSTAKLTQFYAKHAIQVDCQKHEPVDHIGLIMVTLAYLFEQLAGNSEDEFKQSAAIELLQEHLLPWGGRCLSLAEQHANTAFYRAIAHLAQVYLRTLAEALGVLVVQRKLYR